MAIELNQQGISASSDLNKAIKVSFLLNYNCSCNRFSLDYQYCLAVSRKKGDKIGYFLIVHE